MPDSTEEIVYLEAARAIGNQQRALDELRSRTALLLAAAGVIAAFLGTAAIEDGVDIAGVLAIVFFAILAVLSILILLPREDAWMFSLNAKTLIEDHLDVPERNSASKLHRFLAEWLDEHYTSNKAHLDGLYRLYWWASVLLAVDIGLWLLELSID